MSGPRSDTEIIQLAFGQDVTLCDRILAAARDNRDQWQLFVDIAKYTSSYTYSDRNDNGVPADAPSAKRRRTEGSSDGAAAAAAATAATTARADVPTSVLFSAPDTSFAVPQRKKMTVQLAAEPHKLEDGAIKIVHEASGVNLAVPFSKIEQVFCLPVPEKAQRQWNFIVFANEALDAKTGSRASDAEQIVWTMNEVAPANVKATGGFEPLEVDTYVTSTMRSLNTCLKGFGKGVIIPTDKEFASAIPQSHRKGESAYHVKAHRGSKDGYLFFLSVGIVWAFKKPLSLFTFDRIESISYTSVLQRTFNVVITTMPDEDGNKQEIEFSMLDQADYAGINDYVQRHELNDASMAADRRAKKLNINPKPKTEGDEQTGDAAHDDDDDEETELQKAEKELQDAEDEEEEDYDPGSDGESEGEGSSDGEEDGDGGGGRDDDDDDDDMEGDGDDVDGDQEE